jgi:hypothetical protein
MTRLIQISNPANAASDLIFVHGLDGDPSTTWCHNQNEPANSWPFWIAEDLPSTAVWTLGYEASASDWLGHSMPLVHRAGNVLTAFESEGVGTRPVLFICHSLGGLLIKQALRHAEGYGVPEWKGFLQKTNGIIFLATPHAGSHLADYLDRLRIIFRPSASIQDLRKNSPALEDLNIWFRNFVSQSDLYTLSYFETRTTKGVHVVDHASADIGLAGRIPRAVDADHIQICKPTSKDDPVVYRYIVSHVNRLTAPSTSATAAGSSHSAHDAGEQLRASIERHTEALNAQMQPVFEARVESFVNEQTGMCDQDRVVLDNSGAPISEVRVTPLTAFRVSYYDLRGSSKSCWIKTYGYYPGGAESGKSSGRLYTTLVTTQRLRVHRFQIEVLDKHMHGYEKIFLDFYRFLTVTYRDRHRSMITRYLNVDAWGYKELSKDEWQERFKPSTVSIDLGTKDDQVFWNLIDELAKRPADGA